MGIAQSAMLVEMNISVWTAQKHDKEASRSVTTAANALADAGQFRKNLMAGTTLRKEIADYAALCRTWHNSQTMPWSDKGPRLLPTSLFLDYKTEANARRAHFETMVDKFIGVYPQLLVGAQQRNMGGLFDPSDYPHPSEIAAKFGFRLVFAPVPEAQDFRIAVSEEELEALREEYSDVHTQRVEEAMKSSWTKLHAMLEGMSEKLVEPDGDGTKVFHGTFLTNAHEMCRMLDHFNISDDELLRKATNVVRKRFAAAVDHVDILDLRKEASVRAEMKEKIDDVKDKVGTVLASFNEW